MAKKTFNVDTDLLRRAREACGAATDTDTIRQGLEFLVRRAAGERIIALFGTEPQVKDVLRRRAERVKRTVARQTAKPSTRKRRAA